MSRFLRQGVPRRGCVLRILCRHALEPAPTLNAPCLKFQDRAYSTKSSTSRACQVKLTDEDMPRFATRLSLCGWVLLLLGRVFCLAQEPDRTRFDVVFAEGIWSFSQGSDLDAVEFFAEAARLKPQDG